MGGYGSPFYGIVPRQRHCRNRAFPGGCFCCARFRPLSPPAVFRTVPHERPAYGCGHGKEGEEVWTDQHGRCKVRFHWQGASDETSSCWVRVAQPWTGNGYGALFLPRIGQEVVISFVGGDPDRPLVTGMVYNSGNPPPWALPRSTRPVPAC